MMGLLGLLVLVVILINFAADSANWVWLTGEQVEPEAPAGKEEVAGPRRVLRDEEDELPPGGFRTPMDRVRPAGDAAATARKGEDEDTGAESPVAEAEGPVGMTLPPAGGATVPADETTLDPALVAAARDDTLGFFRAEWEAALTILAKARDLRPDVMEREALNNVSYSQLFADPERYRGRLITFEDAVLKRLTSFTVPENPHGIERIYEAWFFTRDSGKNPFVLRCTSIPEGIPQGESIDERIRLTGYFFKVYQYESVGGLYAAPMLLGKRLRWIPAPAKPQTDPHFIPYLLGGLALIGTVLGIAVWWFAAHETRVRRSSLARVRMSTHEPGEALQNIQAVDLHEVLQELAEEHREEEEKEEGEEKEEEQEQPS